MSNAPFYVGQRVVCIDGNHFYTKGEYYIVAEIFKCNCGWRIGAIVNERSDGEFLCGTCCHSEFGVQHWSALAKRFAPVEYEYADITNELANSIVIGDTSDIKINQPVNN